MVWYSFDPIARSYDETRTLDRYAIDAAKIQQELGWVPAHRFEQGIRETVRWYLDHQDWVMAVLKK